MDFVVRILKERREDSGRERLSLERVKDLWKFVALYQINIPKVFYLQFNKRILKDWSC